MIALAFVSCLFGLWFLLVGVPLLISEMREGLRGSYIPVYLGGASLLTSIGVVLIWVSIWLGGMYV